MIRIDIPGFGLLVIHRVVTDYTGTLSCKGLVREAVRARLARLARLVPIHVLTVDTFGTVRGQLKGLRLDVQILKPGARQDRLKQQFVVAHEPRHIAAFGNGTIDRLMLKAVRAAGGLAVAVDNGEGCSAATARNANVIIHGSERALDLLLSPDTCKATLRF